MKYLREYNEVVNRDIYVKTFDTDGFLEFLGKGDFYIISDKHRDVFGLGYEKERIRFASTNDFAKMNRYTDDGHPDPEYRFRRFVVLLEGDKIIGICKVGNTSESTKRGGFRSLSIYYFSIDRNYRGRNLSKIMINELVDMCLRENFTLEGGCWSVNGLNRLRQQLIRISKQKGLEYTDMDDTLDCEAHYYKGVHWQELTPEEEKEYRKKQEEDRIRSGRKPSFFSRYRK